MSWPAVQLPALLMLGVAITALPMTAMSRTRVVGRDAPTIAATLALARPGDVVELPRGRWPGALRLDKAITLRGVGPGAVIDGGGRGVPLTIAAAGARVENLTIRGSGKDLSKNEACVLLERSATGAVLSRSRIEDCAFGVWVDRTAGARIIGNTVIGSQIGHRSLRGNGIHLFDASKLTIANNRVSGGRDGIYVSATEDSVIANNVVEKTRYCVHYMFSYRNTLSENICRNNASGFALMESHRIKVLRNVATDNEQHGLLFRDAENCTIVDNRLERNGEGMFFFSSVENEVARNLIKDNRIGARVWAGSLRNTVRNNSFVGNQLQVFYIGQNDLVWGVVEEAHAKKRATALSLERGAARGNYWSDYLGWDQDGDGVGDRPYRVSGFAASLVARFPAASLLLRSPALELLALLELRMPLLRRAAVVDRAPLMAPSRALSAKAAR